jgi:hypothetical protein
VWAWVGAWPKDVVVIVIDVFVVVVVVVVFIVVVVIFIFVIVEALGHAWGLLGRCFLFLFPYFSSPLLSLLLSSLLFLFLSLPIVTPSQMCKTDQLIGFTVARDNGKGRGTELPRGV